MFSRLFQSSIGKKILMALTGMALFGFVVAHMVGNLQIYFGPKLINDYGHFLQSSPEILWPARMFLLACVGIHIWAAVTLAAMNRSARPVGYDGAPAPRVASYASRTMMMSGLIVLSFIIYHLLHFTAQVKAINLTGVDFNGLTDADKHHDVYRMMVTGFSSLPVSIFYVIGMGLLCTHLSHGLSAMFQSLGLKNKAYGPLLDRFAVVAAVIIFAGNCSIPLAILTGIVK